jgi:hypothetical protein
VTKLAYIVLGIAMLVGAVIVSGASGAVVPVHAYLLADGGQPPPDPLPFCLPPLIPCLYGSGDQLRAGGDAQWSTDVAILDRRGLAVSARQA